MSSARVNREIWPKRIIRLGLTDSTQERARFLLHNGVDPDFAILAREQHAGQGRLGRQWVSERNLGLYCTISLRPVVPTEYWPQASLVMAVAAADAVERAAGVSLRIKWPNDLYHDGRKVGGILAETVVGADGNPLAALIGVGINVGHAHDDFPPELAGRAISLRGISGQNIDVTSLFNELLSCFHSRAAQWRNEGFAPLRRAWLERDCAIGKPVTIGADGEKCVVVAIDADGCLLVEDAAGTVRTIICDDVVLAGATSPS